MTSSQNCYMNLKKVFSSAVVDRTSVPMDGNGYLARIVKGVKIVMDIDTEAIAIYNTSTRGLFPKEITEEQYKVFADLGWSDGVRYVQTANLKREIIRIRYLIGQEQATNLNYKRLNKFNNQLKKVQDELQKIIGG